MTYNEIIPLLSPEKMYECPADIYGHSSEYLTADEAHARLLYIRDYWKERGQELNITFGNEFKNFPVWDKNLLLKVNRDVVRIEVTNEKIKEFEN